MLPDMHIYENNIEAYEQKIMESMTHERSLAMLADKEDQLSTLINQNNNLCEFCLFPESEHTPSFHCANCSSKKLVQERVNIDCANKCISCAECIQKTILAQANNNELKQMKLSTASKELGFKCMCTTEIFTETQVQNFLTERQFLVVKEFEELRNKAIAE